MRPVRWAASAVGVAAAICVANATAASDPARPAPRFGQAAPEFSQSASKLEKGQLFMTSGLVCDRPSEVDAVITLARKGEHLNAALEQINTGTRTPRCIVGRMLIARYLDKVQTFRVADETFQVHEVQVVGVAVQTPAGLVPMRLKKPMKQYVVSTDETVPA